MTYYNKKKTIAYMVEQLEEYDNPETDPRTPRLDEINKLQNMNDFELTDYLRDDDDIGDAFKDELIKELKAAKAPQSELKRVKEKSSFEVMNEFGVNNAEILREIAINNVNKQLDDIEEDIEDLRNDIEKTRSIPSRYFD